MTLQSYISLLAFVSCTCKYQKVTSVSSSINSSNLAMSTAIIKLYLLSVVRDLQSYKSSFQIADIANIVIIYKLLILKGSKYCSLMRNHFLSPVVANGE